MQDIGDRMKEFYENRYRFYLTRRTPVIIRVDLRAGHSFTKDFQKPFDSKFINSMFQAAYETAKEIQGFKLAYIQSDEASFLLTDYDDLQTDAWFGYNKSKIETITASTFSVEFNCEIQEYLLLDYGISTRRAVFDARSFNLPKEEVVNYFLWRAKDWERNSLQMYCRNFFSDKQMHNKSREDQHELLFSIGKNWANDLSLIEKNGTYLINTDTGIHTNFVTKPNYEDISRLLSTARGIV